jgi:hypothetical protein
MRGLGSVDTDMYAARRMKGRPRRDYIYSLSNLSAYITSNRKECWKFATSTYSLEAVLSDIL